MDQSIFPKTRFKKLDHPIQLKTLAGQKSIEYELVTNVPIEFKERATMAWKISDLSNKNFKALLGLNILKPLAAKIDLLKDQLMINNQVIKFKNSCPFEVIHQIETIDLNHTALLERLNTNNLNSEEFHHLKQILRKNEDLFFKEGDYLTSVKEVKHQIVTTDSRPIYSKIYRFPKIHEEEVNKQIREMLQQNIIQPSNSPYNSPIWVVPKKVDNSGEQKWRIVIDYRKLNEVTIEDKFPIPNIESIFDKLGRAQYFTTLDLAKGFHQILVDEKDRPKTAFSTPQGHYEFVRMPFGLKNAPATFQRMINHVLRDQINKTCVVYLDDILIFSTSLQEHINSIHEIFEKLRASNLKIQIDKCNFFSKQTEYLGHILTNEGIKPNTKKVEAIQNLKIPHTRKQIKSFLGITGYYRKFIKDYAKVAQPMTRHLKKDSKINTNDPSYRDSFEKLKELITNYPTLRYPDFKKKFVLTTDASNFAIGAVLSQDNHPICYASRTLNKHETNYSAIEKELLAIIWATKYFRPYLYGTKFTIRTDHQPLTWLNSLKEPNAKLQRWRIRLNEYDFEIEYVKGKDNKVADFLSRINKDSREINEAEEMEIDNSSDQATIHSGIENLNDHIPIMNTIANRYFSQIYLLHNKEQEFVKKYNRYRQLFISEEDLENESYLNDILRRRISKGISSIYSELEDSKYNILQSKLIELFSNERKIKFVKCTKRAKDLDTEDDALKLIQETHEATNHRGILENYSEIKDTYFYPKLKELVHKFINNCDICNLSKYDRKPIQYKFEISETPCEPNQILHADLFFCYKRTFLTMIDKFTKHLMIQILNDRNAITIIELFRNRFAIFGKPKKIVLDNEFNSINIKDFLRQEDILVHFTSPRSHTGNSDIERVHGTINEHLRILEAKKSKLSPIEKVLFACETYNNTIHSTTQEKPSSFVNNKVEKLHIVRDRMLHKKYKTIENLNRDRVDIKLENNDETLVRNPDAERHKHLPKYVKLKTKLNNKKLTDTRNRNVHISRIKRKYKFFPGSQSTTTDQNNTDQ